MNSFESIYLKETKSTNTYAKALLKSGEPSMPYTLIYTDNQLSGRGRLGRVWLSKKDETLCMSLIAPYPYNPAITLLSALGVHRALTSLTDADIKIKWPNDLVSDNKKLCGILTESTDKYAVIGIGINLNTTDFPEEISHKATSLTLIEGKHYNLQSVAKSVAESVISTLEETKGTLSEDILSEYTSLCVNLGRSISFSGHTGVATGIAPDGCLIAEYEGKTEYINSGEVIVSGIY